MQPLRLDRELAGPGAEHGPLDADPVAEVEQPVQLEARVADDVLFHVELDLRRPVPEVGKGRLPGAPQSANPAGDRDLHRLRVEERHVVLAVRLEDGGNRAVCREEIRVGAVAEGDDGREVRLAVADQLVFGLFRLGCRLVLHPAPVREPLF